jgi:multidrug efflux pump subunit AcrB
MPGQYDRYNMKRLVSLTANISGADLGLVSSQVKHAIQRVGDAPTGSAVEIRGQIPPMHDMEAGLSIGLLLAILAVFLLLTANFQSLRLALVTVSTIPAVVAGVALMLYITGTTINIQSFIGAIMAVGVAMANAILLVTFAEKHRVQMREYKQAAVKGAGSRLRAILMTSSAMIAGMLPMALALGEAGQQNAPLGRAVVGGLLAATLATLFLLPIFFAILQSQANTKSASMDPDDPESRFFSTR